MALFCLQLIKTPIKSTSDQNFLHMIPIAGAHELFRSKSETNCGGNYAAGHSKSKGEKREKKKEFAAHHD